MPETTQDDAEIGAAPERKSRSGSETRRRSSLVSLRLLPEQRKALDEEAQRRGLKSLQELILQQLGPVLAGEAIAS